MLRALRDREASGCLHLRRGEQRAQLWLRGGGVYTAQAPEARARLGDRLVGAGELEQADLDAALAAQRADQERRRIGELLVERGAIDRETLRRYVQGQILDSVTATLSWRDGEWRFEQGAETVEDAPLDMTVENLLMDATRRLEEWEVIHSALGSTDAVVDFAPRSSGAEVALTPDEWSLMTRIDGQSSVSEIADDAGYGQFETARILYGLLTAGIVQIVPDEEPAPLDVDRDALLSELAALRGDDDGARSPREASSGSREPQPGRGRKPSPADAQGTRPVSSPAAERDERRGFLDRFRKGG